MDYDEDTFEFAIDGEFYTVTEDAGSAYLIDENGASILIGELEENRGKLILDNPSAAASSSWVLVSSNNHKTIILYQKFLYLISTVYNMGKVYYKYKTEGSMGTINILMATAAAIGQWCSVTAYVIYTQYYRSDCTAYYHEYGDIYTADGSSYMDHYDTYFHSVRPDYAELLSL